MENQLPGLLAIPPADLTPQTLSALGSNMYRYYATALDGQVIFTLSRELRTAPTAVPAPNPPATPDVVDDRDDRDDRDE